MRKIYKAFKGIFLEVQIKNVGAKEIARLHRELGDTQDTLEI